MLLADVRFEPPHQKEKNALALALCALLLTVRFRQRSSPQCDRAQAQTRRIPKERSKTRRSKARQGYPGGTLGGGGARVLYDANDTGRRDFVVEGRRGLDQWDSNDVGARPTCATAMAPNRPQQSTLPKGLPLTGWRRQMSALWRSNLASYMTIECPIIELLPSSIRVLSI